MQMIFQTIKTVMKKNINKIALSFAHLYDYNYFKKNLNEGYYLHRIYGMIDNAFDSSSIYTDSN